MNKLIKSLCVLLPSLMVSINVQATTLHCQSGDSADSVELNFSGVPSPVLVSDNNGMRSEDLGEKVSLIKVNGKITFANKEIQADLGEAGEMMVAVMAVNSHKNAIYFDLSKGVITVMEKEQLKVSRNILCNVNR